MRFMNTAQSSAGIGFQLQAIRNKGAEAGAGGSGQVDLRGMPMARTSHEEVAPRSISARPPSANRLGIPWLPSRTA